MSDTPRSPGEPEFSDSDRQWFDRLAGRTAPVTDAAAVREADALRRVFELDEARADADDPELVEALSVEAKERSWQATQFRLRRVQAERRRAGWLRRAGVGVTLAAGVLVAVVALKPAGDTIYYDEPPTLRGDLDVTRVVDPTPKRSAEALAQSLGSAGLPASVHQRGKTFTVDAVVAADTPPAALERLRGVGVKAGAGVRRIEFVPR